MSVIEAPRGEKAFHTVTTPSFVVSKDEIDAYDHMGHGRYPMVFGAIRRENHMGLGMQVAGLSIAYSQELVLGDDTSIQTDQYKVTPEVEKVVQTIKKVGSTRGTRQTTLLVSPDTRLLDPDTVTEFSLEKRDPVIERHATVPTPLDVDHTKYARLFEVEREDALLEKGTDLPTIRHTTNTLIVALRLDAVYGDQSKIQGPLNLATTAYLDRHMRNIGFMGFVFLQSAHLEDGTHAVTQLTSYLFLDATTREDIKPIPTFLHDLLMAHKPKKE